jgi:hypothetical protein
MKKEGTKEWGEEDVKGKKKKEGVEGKRKRKR